jgi:hypothetical protein
MTKNNRERQAEFKQRMREAGKKQITVWVTQAQEKLIRALLDESSSQASEVVAAPECDEGSAPKENDSDNQ